jgi:hypothetical protein
MQNVVIEHVMQLLRASWLVQMLTTIKTEADKQFDKHQKAKIILKFCYVTNKYI